MFKFLGTIIVVRAYTYFRTRVFLKPQELTIRSMDETTPSFPMFEALTAERKHIGYFFKDLQSCK